MDAHTLEVFQRVEDRWLLVGTYGDEALVRAPPFEQVELAVARIFLPKAE